MEKSDERGDPSLQMEDLPYEVLTIIFSKLPVSDIFNVILTCKKFREVVINNHGIWKKKCLEAFLVKNHKKYQSRKCIDVNPHQLYRVSSNWRKGYFKGILLAQSEIKYIPWLSLQTEYLLLSTGNALTCYSREKKRLSHGQKCVWRLMTPTVKRSGMRTNDISRFVIKDNSIVCGNRDGCIAIYQLQGGYPISSIPRLSGYIRDCHRDGQVEVSAVECLEGRDTTHFVSCSVVDNVVKFWRRKYDYEQSDGNCFECIREVKEDIYGAKCMQIYSRENTLAVGLDNNTRPLLVDVEMGRILYNAEETSNTTDCIRDIHWINSNTVAYVRHKGFLSVFDRRTNKVVYNNYDPLNSSLYSLQSDGAQAVVAGTAQLSRCVLYDLRTSNNFVQMFFTQKCSSPVYSVAFDANVLVAAAERAVGVLNFNININGVRMRDYASMIRNRQH